MMIWIIRLTRMFLSQSINNSTLNKKFEHRFQILRTFRQNRGRIKIEITRTVYMTRCVN